MSKLGRLSGCMGNCQVRVILVMGVSGSGKTTIASMLASRLGWNFLEADDFHSDANIAKMSSGAPLTDEDRQPWLEDLGQRVRGAIDNDQPVVLACSALKRNYRRILTGGDSRVALVFLDGSLELIRSRMEKRQHFMPPELLVSQFEALEEPQDALTISIEKQPVDAVQEIIDTLGLS